MIEAAIKCGWDSLGSTRGVDVPAAAARCRTAPWPAGSPGQRPPRSPSTPAKFNSLLMLGMVTPSTAQLVVIKGK